MQIQSYVLAKEWFNWFDMILSDYAGLVLYQPNQIRQETSEYNSPILLMILTCKRKESKVEHVEFSFGFWYVCDHMVCS